MGLLSDSESSKNQVFSFSVNTTEFLLEFTNFTVSTGVVSICFSAKHKTFFTTNTYFHGMGKKLIKLVPQTLSTINFSTFSKFVEYLVVKPAMMLNDQ